MEMESDRRGNIINVSNSIHCFQIFYNYMPLKETSGIEWSRGLEVVLLPLTNEAWIRFQISLLDGDAQPSSQG